MKDFFTDEKVAELISCIRETGFREGGFKKFAARYKLSWHKVKKHFYKHILTPELDKNLPRKDIIKPRKDFIESRKGVIKPSGTVHTVKELLGSQEKAEELLAYIEKAGGKRKGFVEFAKKYNLNPDGVQNYFYQNINLRTNNSLKKFFNSQEKVKELFTCIEEAGCRKKGFKKFAEKYNLNPAGVQNYFYQNIYPWSTSQETPSQDNPSQKVSPQELILNVQSELHKVITEKGFPVNPLSKEDIDAVAKKTGAHYHTVLSTLGFIASRGEYPAKIASEPEWRYHTSKYSTVRAEARIDGKRVTLVAEEENAKRQLEKVKPGCVVTVTGEFTNVGPEVQFKVRSISGLEESLRKLEEEQSREREEWESVRRAAVEGMFGERLRVPSDIDRLLDRVSRQKGVDKEKLEKAYMELMDSPVYDVWRAMLREKELEIKRLELRDVFKKTQTKETQTNPAESVVSREQAEHFPTFGYVLNLYKRIAEQEEEIRALRKLNLVCLEALQKRNVKHWRFPESATSETAQEIQEAHVH